MLVDKYIIYSLKINLECKANEKLRSVTFVKSRNQAYKISHVRNKRKATHVPHAVRN